MGNESVQVREGTRAVAVELNGEGAAARGRGAAAGARVDPSKCIRVRGAKEHNLKNIDVDIPRDKLVVITGLSGSGKSSLAFDTIFAEGQRKYMESLSAYARQFLEQLKKPDVEDIEGLPPTIAIEQRSGVQNPRSTVATTTEIYDYLRLLYARCGRPRCWAPTKTKKDGTVLERCGRAIEASSATQIVETVLNSAGESNARAMILAPVVRAKKGFHKEVLEDVQGRGWGRVRVNGQVLDVREVLKKGGENPLGLGRYEKHDIDVVIDRLTLGTESRQRIAESVEAALKLADGTVVVSVEEGEGKSSKFKVQSSNQTEETDRTGEGRGGWTDRVFSAKFACPEHPECALEEMTPRIFSFNSPSGACTECHGLGMILEFDEDLVIPDRGKSLTEGAIKPWKVPPPMGRVFRRHIRNFCKDFGVSPAAPVSALPEWAVRILIYGTSPEDVDKHGESFAGVNATLRKWYEKTESAWMKEWLGQYMQEKTCPTCRGDRLRIGSLSVMLESGHEADTKKAFSGTVLGRSGKENDGRLLNIAELSRLTINDAVEFMERLALTAEQTKIAEPITKEVLGRLGFLRSVGLEYLSLDRKTGTLSGGEAQRIRLATQVGSKLVGACYVLDEPTIGLHQRDNARLIATLRHLADIGNTVLVVEHDEEMIRAADHVIDIGPGPGVHGGRVVAQGHVEDIEKEGKSSKFKVQSSNSEGGGGNGKAADEYESVGSFTALYLSGRKMIEQPGERRKVNAEKNAVVVKGARENNLKGIDVAFPLGGLVLVTGVSGSGKSTLVNDILLSAAKRELTGSRTRPGAHDKIAGLKKVDRVIEVDQSPIGRTPRSNPATYTGIFDDIRKIFATTKEAKIRGYKPARFSFNVRGAGSGGEGGRCEACEGQGLKKIEMHFLADVYVTCEVCGGSRYNRETLEVRYRGKSIADVLGMTVEDAIAFFENHPKILRFVQCLKDVGLGYIELGQPSTTLSGGEAQRVKLATELGKGAGDAAGGGHGLYILDEPTTGLHFEDVNRLLAVLNRLAAAGNMLVVIEHNLDVIKCADWIIDLGPEGGDGGGRIVAAGTPEQVMRVKESHTGRYLKMHVEAERSRSRH